MGGCSIDGDRELTSSAALTLVLVGKTGNGKSATGNSIIGSKEFESKRSSSGVTNTSELSTIELEDGRVLNVIDTPGMFDSSLDPETIGEQIVRCINMAKDGLHAVLVVFSICSRFSEEENAVISSLVALFGTKIYDYVIIVFTGGDELEDDGKSLDDFLRDSPDALKEILCLCGDRRVLFDNKTKDQTKKAGQVQQLLSCVKTVLEKNGGEPYTNEMFTELQKKHKDLQEQTEKIQALKLTKEFTQHDMLVLIEQMRHNQLKLIIEMFESKFKEIQLKLEKLLEEEKSAREKAESNAKEEQKKSKEEIEKLKKKLKEAKEAKEAREAKAKEAKEAKEAKNNEAKKAGKAWYECVIL
ncbi:P-loop containing nucleoside triphosphate hydrolase [Artemisia annua]|uniref:P-loop containing nucleoside triphosphate hydrolase n=1 Tax=Artemisia annua TaxID=35608 RepID=A0A2U1M942_ARTAN|nr:P-loop containing nucleoside triphosphate hydrolase [Artemisia annua]